MTGTLLPPPNVSAIHECVYIVYSRDGREHRCGKRSVAVHWDTERRPLCAVHERIYLRARQ